jgi:putative phosphoribosyl transferase
MGDIDACSDVDVAYHSRDGRLAYRGDRHPLSVDGKTVIIVDDGAATGTTMKVAIRALKRRSPREIVVALPVAPAETIAQLSPEADRVVCLSQPAHFPALSYYYRNFPQLSDEDVVEALQEAARRRRARATVPSSRN